MGPPQVALVWTGYGKAAVGCGSGELVVVAVGSWNAGGAAETLAGLEARMRSNRRVYGRKSSLQFWEGCPKKRQQG